MVKFIWRSFGAFPIFDGFVFWKGLVIEQCRPKSGHHRYVLSVYRILLSAQVHLGVSWVQFQSLATLYLLLT